MIDKEQPLDVCKIEAKKQIDHRIEHDSISKTKALKIVADESGIPYNTLKQWFYPKSNENRKHKRRKKKVVSIENGEKLEETSDPIVVQTSLNSGNKKRYILRLPPELDKSIIEYKNKYKLEHVDAFIQLLDRGLKNQKAAAMELALRKELRYINENIAEPMGLPTTEALHTIVDHYLHFVKKETEQR